VTDVDRVMTRLNPVVAWILRSPLHPLLSWGLMLVTVTGRRSGRRYTIPVGYQQDGTAITVLVSKAPRKQWWRNYREPAPVDLWLRGEARTGRARVVPADSEEFRRAIDATMRRIPGLGRQFGVAYDRAVGLTAAQAGVVAQSGAVVRVDLAG
jgi:deazaflavin-dependent oxidoreductase (nitroreductase family)